MSSPTSSPSPSPLRPSKFIEGTPLTRPDLLARTPTSNELLLTILSEMDAFESERKKQRRSHRGSESSASSVASAASYARSSHTPAPAPTATAANEKLGGFLDGVYAAKEGRRSINFGRRRSEGSEGARRGEHFSFGGSGGGGETTTTTTTTLARRVVGRLRALTAGREQPRGG